VLNAISGRGDEWPSEVSLPGPTNEVKKTFTFLILRLRIEKKKKTPRAAVCGNHGREEEIKEDM
jgi:hypothetical protein